MNNISIIRINNLKKIVEQQFNNSFNLLAKHLNKNVNAFYLIQRGERKFGEELARKIEEQLHLATGTLDETENTGISTKVDYESIRKNNLEQYITKFYENMRQFCLKIDYNYGSLHSILSGNKPFGDKVARELEEKAGLARYSLDMVESDNKIGKPQISVNFVQIPIYNGKFLIGPGEEVMCEEKIGDLPLPIEYIQADGTNTSDLIAFAVTNDSMANMIMPGTVIVIDKSKRDIIDNKQYAFLINDDPLARVKTLRKAIDGIIVHSENSDYNDEKILNNSDVKFIILGKVVWAATRF